MNTGRTVCEDKILVPDDQEEQKFLEAIQDPEKRAAVIAVLRSAGLLPVC